MNPRQFDQMAVANRQMAKTIEQLQAKNDAKTDRIIELEATITELRARLEKLEAALESIEEIIDTHMGEWSSVDLTYLPPEMYSLHDIREQIRYAIAKAKGAS